MPLIASGSRLIRHRASTAWYLAGGISASNCIAAYAPKGAASQAASYTNLANPGTNNAAPGTAPTWDATNGWKFSAASSQYLTTGITPASDQSWSMIVRYSNGTLSSDMYLAGARIATNRFYLNFSEGLNRHLYGHGSFLTTGTGSASGVMAIAGAAGYFNGSSEGAIAAGTGTINVGVVIGANNNAGTIGNFATAYIQAVAIYNVSVATYMSALTTAMNAL